VTQRCFQQHREWNFEGATDRKQLRDIVVRTTSRAQQLWENFGGYLKTEEYPIQFEDFRGVSVPIIFSVPYFTSWLLKRLQHRLVACPRALTVGRCRAVAALASACCCFRRVGQEATGASVVTPSPYPRRCLLPSTLCEAILIPPVCHLRHVVTASSPPPHLWVIGFCCSDGLLRHAPRTCAL